MAENLGPYQILGELGRGAMAIVWRAHDTRLDREVAVKEPVVPAGTDATTAAELSARFVREGKAAAKLNHPGIVTIHAADIYDGRPAIVMELIEGETLGAILDRGALQPAVALAVLDQLLDAVGFAHSRGVVHRDIKPDNIFVTPDGRVKLTDFGIAHVGTTAALTQAGTIMGTPGYMAPEQVTGQPVDARADLFAIGVIAYEMLTGQNPFGATSGEAATTIMYRIVHESAPALPADVLAGIALDLAGVISVALAKDPTNRFVDANAFRTALAGGPIITAGALSQGGAVAPTLYPSAQAAAATIVSQQSQQSRPTWMPYALVGGAGVLVIGALFMFAGGPPTGTASGGAVAPAATTEQAASEVVPASGSSAPVESGPTDSDSLSYLSTVFNQIDAYGNPDSGQIYSMAKRFNADPLNTTGATDSTLQAAQSLCDQISATTLELENTDVTATYSNAKSAQLQLLAYCYTRADAIVRACEISQYGGDIKPPLDEGRAAKASYLALLPQGQP